MVDNMRKLIALICLLLFSNCHFDKVTFKRVKNSKEKLCPYFVSYHQKPQLVKSLTSTLLTTENGDFDITYRWFSHSSWLIVLIFFPLPTFGLIENTPPVWVQLSIKGNSRKIDTCKFTLKNKQQGTILKPENCGIKMVSSEVLNIVFKTNKAPEYELEYHGQNGKSVLFEDDWEFCSAPLNG